VKYIYLVLRAESYGTQQVYWLPERAFETEQAANQEAGRYGRVKRIPLYDSESREG